MSTEPTESESADEEGYVHRPAAVDTETAYTGKETGEGFGARGWVLVAGIVMCFLVIPGIIYLNPTAPAQFGWTFFATFLVLPLIPAVILGLLAVWSMQAAA